MDETGARQEEQLDRQREVEREAREQEMRA